MIELVERDVQPLASRWDFSFFAGRRVLLTGASGLIGTYLLAALTAIRRAGVGFELVAITRSGRLFSPVDGVPGFAALSLDLASFADYARIPRADVVIHAAGYGQPVRFLARPADFLRISTAGTAALFDRLEPGGTFALTSSAAVYAGNPDPPFDESAIGRTNPYHPRAAYIEGKRCGEALCAAYGKAGFRTVVLRLADIYGPGTRKDDTRSINNFIDAALRDGRIRMLDEGLAFRNYLYVADAVEASLRVVAAGREAVYNLGDDQPVRICEMARRIGALCGVPVQGPAQRQGIDGSAENLSMDLTRIRAEFGPIKRVELDEGLGRTIAWRRALFSAE